jgi:mRNA-degrading endonuclease YafQ of YafQ-DinJ toxin-antitoxin module
MIVRQSGIFSRRVKKLHSAEKQALDEAIKEIIKNHAIGELKIGDLAGVQVYKYKDKTRQNLLAYRFSEKDGVITLLALGSHENFYRDLKKQ